MPFVLLRHAPAHGHLGEAWIVKVRQIDNPVLLAQELEKADLRGYPPAHVDVERTYRRLAPLQIKEMETVANGMRTLHDFVHLVMIKGEIQWRTQSTKGIVQRGGESLANRLTKADEYGSENLQIEKISVEGTVATTSTRSLVEAIDHFADVEDWTVLYLFSDPECTGAEDEETKIGKEAILWSDLIIENIQKQVDAGAQLEEAIRKAGIVRDKHLFLRSYLRPLVISEKKTNPPQAT